MDNRFNVKDIVMIVLVVLVGGLVLMAMVQNQRHWDVLETTTKELKEQREAQLQQKKDLDLLRRNHETTQAGLEAMTQELKTMTQRWEALIEKVESKESGSDSSSLLVPADGSLAPDVESWVINFRSTPIDNTETFGRVLGLPGQPDYARGDFFIDAFSATVKSLTPYIAGDVYSDRIDDYVLETLLTTDPITLEPKPWIATRWEVSDDGLTFTFYMRDDVVFSDGKPLTAHDVEFTYDWVMNPRIAAPRTRAYYNKFEYVRAVDDYTVEFKFREPYFQSLSLCGGMDILAKHYYSRFTEDEYNEMPGLLFGSGPYKMRVDPEKWKPGSQKIEVVRNDNYWGPQPALQRVIWREILEDTAMEAEFRNRGIDRLSVRASSYRKLSRDDDLRRQANLYEYESVNSGYIYIGWNQEKNGRPTRFADKRVRQAMTLLINREQICSRVYDNLASPASGPFHPLGWQADPTIKPWPFDPERAKALLTEAGYIDRDGDGVRESPDGAPLSFKLICSAGSNETKQLVLLAKDAMAKAGVQLQPDPMDWPIMQQKMDDRDFDAIMLGWGGSIESDVYQMFHSDQTADGGDNYISYRSDEIDKLIEAARTTIDREQCKKNWQKVHAQLHEDQPYTFLYNRKSVIYIDKRVRNVEITNIGPNFAWEYFVPRGVQMHSVY